jgi:hypothetical protein
MTCPGLSSTAQITIHCRWLADGEAIVVCFVFLGSVCYQANDLTEIIQWHGRSQVLHLIQCERMPPETRVWHSKTQTSSIPRFEGADTHFIPWARKQTGNAWSGFEMSRIPVWEKNDHNHARLPLRLWNIPVIASSEVIRKKRRWMIG